MDASRSFSLALPHSRSWKSICRDVHTHSNQGCMLNMRPNCECCDRDLPAASDGAFICSFECTYCHRCATRLDHICINCGGTLEPRPVRRQSLLDRFPPSSERVVREVPCFALGKPPSVAAAQGRRRGGIL
ncbi:MAG TPA: DUF1272 domain-containing protein [Sphingomicrobium sp.]|nr:DUF1272 domain-containing protein [Sphingomicrobium sp.]